MNFNLNRFLYLAIRFIIGSFFLIVGIFNLILPLSSYLKTVTIQFILEHTLILSLFGLGFTLIGLSILIYSFLQSSHRYLKIQTGPLKISLDENVIHQYLEAYWQKKFPSSPVSFYFHFKKHSLEIIANLPSLSLEEQKIFLEQAKEDFSHLFGEVLGYPHEIQFIASFPPPLQ